jgi:hypothetical protein
MSRLRGIDRFDGGLSVRQVFPSILGFVGQRIIIRSRGKGGNREVRFAGRRRLRSAGDLCHRPVANCVEFSVTELSAHFDLFTPFRIEASLGHQDGDNFITIGTICQSGLTRFVSPETPLATSTECCF